MLGWEARRLDGLTLIWGSHIDLEALNRAMGADRSTAIEGKKLRSVSQNG